MYASSWTGVGNGQFLPHRAVIERCIIVLLQSIGSSLKSGGTCSNKLTEPEKVDHISFSDRLLLGKV